VVSSSISRSVGSVYRTQSFRGAHRGEYMFVCVSICVYTMFRNKKDKWDKWDKSNHALLRRKMRVYMKIK
jgi:hypothetical protein